VGITVQPTLPANDGSGGKQDANARTLPSVDASGSLDQAVSSAAEFNAIAAELQARFVSLDTRIMAVEASVNTLTPSVKKIPGIEEQIRNIFERIAAIPSPDDYRRRGYGPSFSSFLE
jgi:hypothetical protein